MEMDPNHDEFGCSSPVSSETCPGWYGDRENLRVRGVRKPIVALVPKGQASRMIVKYGRGVVIDPEDQKSMVEEILRIHELWKEEISFLAQSCVFQ